MRWLLLAMLGLCAGLGGCHWDSYLDPSVVGRWEETPVSVPILERIAAIEADEGDLFEYTEVTEEDLKPNLDPRTIGPGDAVTITAFDLVRPGVPEIIPQVVDQSGYIQVLQLGRIFVSGMTEQEAADEIRKLAQRLVADPLVSVELTTARRQTYSLTGALPGGNFIIPANDYRLLEAMIAAGGIPEQAGPYLFIIRQVALDDSIAPNQPETSGGSPNGSPTPSIGGNTPAPERPAPENGDAVIDLIDELLNADEPGGAPALLPNSAPAPGMLGLVSSQPAQGGSAPPIDLVEPPSQERALRDRMRNSSGPGQASGSRWVFLDGEWVRTARTSNDPSDDADEEEPVVTQRIIRVPIEPLVNGDARYNIVVRPGDVIRLPPPETGTYYLGGQIARPGAYTIPPQGRLTLLRAIDAAGGLGPLAIPERVDIMRMVGPDRQATVMLNLRAIAEQTQPDLYIKPDDRVNIGTNFWAAPLAVLRNAFRASYGFGFLLDRNFGNDVFGAPPFAGPGG